MKALAAKEAELNAGKEPKMSAGISLPGVSPSDACTWRQRGWARGRVGVCKRQRERVHPLFSTFFLLPHTPLYPPFSSPPHRSAHPYRPSHERLVTWERAGGGSPEVR